MKGASNNTIGGTDPSADNVISGNTGAGIPISDAGTMNNEIEGNFIGTDVTGETSLANSTGVAIVGEASNNTIGGTDSTARNVISGNADNGVLIRGVGTTGNLVQGNFIGTNQAGKLSLANQLRRGDFLGRIRERDRRQATSSPATPSTAILDRRQRTRRPTGWRVTRLAPTRTPAALWATATAW